MCTTYFEMMYYNIKKKKHTEREREQTNVSQC